jgi:lysophospholipase L1-like esterase
MDTNRLWRIFSLVLLMSFIVPQTRKTRVWLVGDSTMADKEVRAYPETGWGMPFETFFDSSVIVDNRAKNGRSTKSFIDEGLWAKVLDELQEGDYVLIQFGHNDEGKEKLGRYTSPEEFRTNLRRYVSETRNKKAIPVLITPVARRVFDSAGQVKESHPVYADVVREVATQDKAPLIDLDENSKALLQQFGSVHSKWLYNYLDPGEHPNYPDGHKDDTHFDEFGARKMAEIVLAGIRILHLDLANHIRPPLPVKK